MLQVVEFANNETIELSVQYKHCNGLMDIGKSEVVQGINVLR